jgi:REP element-mobilizing transposase RayT
MLYQEKYRIESARLRGWDYRSRGWYLVTICTNSKRCVLGRISNKLVRLSRWGIVADQELKTLSQHYENVRVDSYVVMPNHIHAIVMIDGDHQFSPNSVPLQRSTGSFSPQAGSLSAVVRSYKAGVTLKCHESGFRGDMWQASFHDHLIRGDRGISAAREYIWNNPATWAEDRERSFLRG